MNYEPLSNEPMDSYDAWRTWVPEGHDDPCICDMCHDWHVRCGDFDINATNHPQDYQCCVDEIKRRILEGEWCGYHDSDIYMKDGKCLECEYEEERKNSKAVGL